VYFLPQVCALDLTACVLSTCRTMSLNVCIYRLPKGNSAGKDLVFQVLPGNNHGRTPKVACHQRCEMERLGELEQQYHRTDRSGRAPPCRTAASLRVRIICGEIHVKCGSHTVPAQGGESAVHLPIRELGQPLVLRLGATSGHRLERNSVPLLGAQGRHCKSGAKHRSRGGGGARGAQLW
jgi:hypothetical protein